VGWLLAASGDVPWVCFHSNFAFQATALWGQAKLSTVTYKAFAHLKIKLFKLMVTFSMLKWVEVKGNREPMLDLLHIHTLNLEL
jgi:hypothetical protein